MNKPEKIAHSQSKTWYLALKHALVILPAIALGVFAMMTGGVSPILCGQQIAAFVIFTLLGMLCRIPRKSFVFAIPLMAMLAATLFFPAVGGAKRWVDLGVLNIHAALLVLPALVLLMDGMRYPHPVLLVTAAILSLQPDLSQLAAFSLAAMPILWKQRKKIIWTIASLILLLLLSIRCFTMPVELESVAYCEGILSMLGSISPWLLAAGALALALIPGYFLYQFIKGRGTAALCFAVYYTVAILFSLTGEYPVLLMGFGLSPIAGYWIAHMLRSSADTAS